MLGGFVTPQVRAGIGVKFLISNGKSYMRNNEGKVVVDQNGLPMQGEDAGHSELYLPISAWGSILILNYTSSAFQLYLIGNKAVKCIPVPLAR